MINILWTLECVIDYEWFKEQFFNMDCDLEFNTRFMEDMQFDIAIIDEIEIIEKIHKKNESVILLLVVDKKEDIYMNQHTLVRYYITKENLFDDLESVIKKFRSEILKKIELISLKHGIIEYKIRKSNIIYIESYKNNLIIHTLARDYTVRLTIKQLLLKLDNNFVQCHKSYIVNINHIITTTSSDIRIGDNSISIGKKFQKIFYNLYENYINK